MLITGLILAAAEQYSLEGVAEKIECPVIITDPDDENFFPGQSQQLYDMVKSLKQLIRFTTAEGAKSL